MLGQSPLAFLFTVWEQPAIRAILRPHRGQVVLDRRAEDLLEYVPAEYHPAPHDGSGSRPRTPARR